MDPENNWSKSFVSMFRVTSRKWLTVAIFQKWQDSSVALWNEIAVTLNWRQRQEILYGFVWFSWFGLVWGGGHD